MRAAGRGRGVLGIAMLAMLAASSAVAQSGSASDIHILRATQRQAQEAPARYFTGSVSLQPLFDARPPARSSGAVVSFRAGARSHWHTHPLGQILIVTQGVGRIQRWDGPVVEIRSGDTVWIPPGIKHWHGAAPDSPMTHLALQKSQDGKAVQWLEAVSDAQYSTALAPGGSPVTQTPSDRRGPYADLAPTLDRITQDTLFGEVWERPALSRRDRSLITVAALVATYRSNELPFHLKFALQNGVTRDELSELITHLAFYSGWPTANAAIEIARKVFAEVPAP